LRRWLIIAIPFAAGLAVLAWKVLRPPVVLVAPVTFGTAIDAVYASGTVEAVDRVDVKARVAGPVSILDVREGDIVQKLQLIARIDVPALGYDVSRGKVDLAAAKQRASVAPQLAALQAELQALEAKRRLANDDRTRAEALASSGAGTQQALDAARAQVDALEAQIAANRAQQNDVQIGLRSDAARQRAIVASLEARASDADVYSPMDGVVLDRLVEHGEVVAVNQTMVRVGDVRRLQLESHVDEADIGKIRVGMPAAIRLYAFEGRMVRGHVVRISPDADRTQKSFQVDLELDEVVDGLRPGMSAEINVIADQRDGVLVTSSEAVHNGGSVYVVNDEAKVSVRHPTFGIRDLATIEIRDGLREGEQVIVSDVSKLEDGQKVRFEAAPQHGNGRMAKAP